MLCICIVLEAKMKLNPDFIKHTIDGQTVLVPTADAQFHGLVQGNDSVAVILECLERDVTEEEIVEEMCRRFSGDRELIASDVADTVNRLKAIGAINE